MKGESRIGGWGLGAGDWLVGFLMGLLFGMQALAQVRVAVLDLNGDERGEAAQVLRTLVRGNQEFELLDEDLSRIAARGAGYAGSLNLSRDEARALGQSLGCDFYLLGKVQVGRRQLGGGQFNFEALAGLFIVETRTGKLASFAFGRVEEPNEKLARERLGATLKQNWSRYAEAIKAAQAHHVAEVENAGQTSAIAITGSSDEILAVEAEPGMQPPVFYQRLKPAYPTEAEQAGIVATVELEAVFQADGKVGAVEVVRWAGFGLDESAAATVRQLRFKPAERAGKLVTIRGFVRYNFRRPTSLAETPEEAERLKRSLRDIQRRPFESRQPKRQ